MLQDYCNMSPEGSAILENNVYRMYPDDDCQAQITEAPVFASAINMRSKFFPIIGANFAIFHSLVLSTLAQLTQNSSNLVYFWNEIYWPIGGGLHAI